MLIHILNICHLLFPWSCFSCKYRYLSWSCAHLRNTFVRFSQEAKKYYFLVLFQQAHVHNVAWTSSRKNADGKINSLLSWWTFSSIVIVINPAKCPDNFSQDLPELLDSLFCKYIFSIFSTYQTEKSGTVLREKLRWKVLSLQGRRRRRRKIKVLYLFSLNPW